MLSVTILNYSRYQVCVIVCSSTFFLFQTDLKITKEKCSLGTISHFSQNEQKTENNPGILCWSIFCLLMSKASLTNN